ncbi:MAG: DUF1211 domain-containing protein [Arenimonas sp.]|nr:DUF1211 domain-containing protein [Arenimonas sp.]
MHKNRLEAFSDGVIAIVITIMVLEMKVPHGDGWQHLLQLWPVFLSYVLSFLYVGVYWNNHHHLLQATHSINGGTLWANLHLLFWLSLMPFTTGWMGENQFARLPTMLYGANLLACAIAYQVLQTQLARHHGADNPMARALGRNFKGKLSMLLYVAGILAAAVVTPMVGFSVFVGVLLLWLVPDRRMEHAMAPPPQANTGGHS